jgi:hypothetical protein
MAIFRFVASDPAAHVLARTALNLGHHQTWSQPYPAIHSQNLSGNKLRRSGEK